MLLTLHALKDLLGTITLMALLAVAYGIILRTMPRRAAQASLGALFGGVAILAMLDPVQVAKGVIVDLRNVPVVLAGAFLGWPGALITTGMAVATRVWMGGIGMLAGAIGIAAVGGIGLAWSVLHCDHHGQAWRGLVALAALSSLYVLSGFLMPWDVAWRMVTTVWPFLVPLHILGVLIVGALLERERRMMREQQQLGHAATRDPLTGLLNRRGFEDTVARLPFAPRGEALLVLDLDHFKRVNDLHGHAAGDAVLRSLGLRLGRALRRDDVIARFGGEEVVVLLPDVDLDEAQATAARLCEVVRAEPFALPSGRSVPVTASVGGAWTSGRATPDALLVRADVALYAAKEAGRDGWRVDVNGRPTRAPFHATTLEKPSAAQYGAFMA
jgi:diguanylate cyclase